MFVELTLLILLVYIFLDFDMTIVGGHRRGYAMDHDPMNKTNKKFIKQKISDWLSNGHNVIIVTRGLIPILIRA